MSGTYVNKHEVRVTSMLCGASANLLAQRTCSGGRIRDIRLVFERHGHASERLIQEMVDEVHLCCRITLGTIDLTVKGGVCHVKLCFPDVSKFWTTCISDIIKRWNSGYAAYHR